MMPPDKAPAEPEMFVATAPLYYNNPASGVGPQLVHRPGAQVTAEAVAANPGWRRRVRPAAPAASPARPRRGKTAADKGE
jgi:hypothetical protein